MVRRRQVLSLAVLVTPARHAFAAEQKPSPRPGPLVVIVGARSPLQEISLARLRAVFLGDAVDDPSGRKLVPINQPGRTPDRVAFDQIVLRMTPDQVTSHWVDRRIRGQGSPPRSVDSVVTLQKLVAAFPGAIAYVRAEQLAAGVRAVRIDGRGHLDPDYPLKR